MSERFMNERFFVGLEADGGTVPITDFSSLGIVLNEETSAWPRGMRMTLSPGNRVAEIRYRTLAMLRDWRNGEFKLNVSLGANELEMSESQGGNISGIWNLRLRIEDLKCGGFRRVKLPEGGEDRLAIKVKPSRRRIQLKQRPSWGAEIRRIVDATRLDDMSGLDWLNSRTRRATRQSCALNILAVSASLGLIEGVRKLVLADVDRVYAEVEEGFAEAVAKNDFKSEGRPNHPTHRRVVEWVTTRMGRAKEDYSIDDLRSFRQDESPSLQVVTLPPKTPGQPHYAEFDIDFGNVFSLPGFFIHAGEVLLPGRTDHFSVFKKLQKVASVEKHLIYEPRNK